jgi:hypothetical protein
MTTDQIIAAAETAFHTAWKRREGRISFPPGLSEDDQLLFTAVVSNTHDDFDLQQAGDNPSEYLRGYVAGEKAAFASETDPVLKPGASETYRWAWIEGVKRQLFQKSAEQHMLAFDASQN